MNIYRNVSRIMAGAGGGGSGRFRSWADIKGLSMQVIASRWFVVFASFLIMSANGTGFMFGLYSSDIKSVLGYDQTTLNLISFFKDLGSNLGVLNGLISEVTPPWVGLILGAALNFFGYFTIWLAVSEKIAKPAVWQMCLYICIGANSLVFPNTCSLVTCVKIFPESRGVVLGILKGYIGLSGAIITQLYYAFYYNDNKALILFIAWLPAAVSFAFLRTLRVMKPKRQANEVNVFYNFLYISLVLAGFLMIMIIVQNKVTFTQSEYGISAASVLVLLFLPLAVVYIKEYELWNSKRLVSLDSCPVQIAMDDNKGNEEQPASSQLNSSVALHSSVTTDHKHVKWWQDIFRPPDRGEDHTILQALFSVDMLILFFAAICGIGGSLTAIDNIGQIGISLGYPKKSIRTFVSILSIWNYLGRVFSGFSSEYFLSRFKFPRPLMLTLVLLFSCIGHLLIASNVPRGLYVASVLVGFCLGAQGPLICAIISELFGLKYYSTLYNFGSVASPIGLYLLNVRVTGKLYDKQAEKELAALGLKRNSEEELTCMGSHCFRLPFMIITAITVFSALVSLILVARTRKFYSSDIYKKFREEPEAAS